MDARPASRTGRLAKSAAPLALCAVLGLFSAAPSLADDAANQGLPSEVNGYHQDDRGVYASLTNEELFLRAEQLRDANIDLSQRVMNYRWLSEQSDQEKTTQGGRAISKLAERKLRAYLDEREGSAWIKQKLLPDNDGSGFIKSVDYDLKLRSDQLVIGVEYEF